MTSETPTIKFRRAILIGLLLSIALFFVWLLVYDREGQSSVARDSITQGWGGSQTIAGPELHIPYTLQTNMVATTGSSQPPRVVTTEHLLILAPAGVDVATTIQPERRSRSIYDVVIYRALTSGRASFALPSDLNKLGIAAGALRLDRAELRFGVSDPRGLSANPVVTAAGRKLPLGPGGGTSLLPGQGFYAPVDLTKVNPARLNVDFRYALRGNGEISLAPRAGDTQWRVKSPWPSPSFAGAFLPEERTVGAKGFDATYRIGNLALGRSLMFTSADRAGTEAREGNRSASSTATIGLVEPVDLYAQVNRATKYGFLFIGFTFLAYLLFDIIGGVRVSGVEYLLAGAGLVLFFVMLLAFAEIIGFAPAYLLAAAAITALNTAYSAAVLKSWRRAGVIAGLLGALYAVLYVLLNLEAFALLIGSLLLFVALAGVMYVTRRLDWAGVRDAEEATE